jgi:Transposase, Mutator family
MTADPRVCKDRRKVAAALKPIYTAPTADAAETELERFDQQWGGRYPMSSVRNTLVPRGNSFETNGSAAPRICGIST